MGLSSLHLPENLQQSSAGLIYFRYRVPNDIQPVLNKPDLKYSLKTHSLRTARQYLAPIQVMLRVGLSSRNNNIFNGKAHFRTILFHFKQFLHFRERFSFFMQHNKSVHFSPAHQPYRGRKSLKAIEPI